MREFVDCGMYFGMGCCLFALGAMVIALIIAMFKDLFR
jgi:hypothetical protein